MGSSCTKSESFEVGDGVVSPETATGFEDGLPLNNGKSDCADYIKRALDEQKITIENITDFSDCLADFSGDELTFNFDHVTINDEAALDEVDDAVNHNSTTKPMHVDDVGTTTGGEDSTGDIDIENRKTTWQRKRRREFEYSVTQDQYSAITEYTMDVRGSTKRQVVAVSDLHLGGAWSEGMDWKLEAYLAKIVDRAKEEIASLVLLGDIFEMWLEKFSETPPTNQQRVDFWKQNSPVLAAAINKLVNDCGVKVFYVRGNHDREITETDVKDLFKENVTFIPCTLVLRMKTADDTEHRIRFAHGHEYDIFNSYMLSQVDNLIPDKPIGYYIARAVATSGRADSDGELEDILIGLAQTLLTMVPASLEDDIVDVLLDHDQHRKLIERLFEGAFKVKDIDFMIQAKCRITGDKWIRLNTLLDYPLLRLCGAMVGKQDVFHMLKASTGDYKKFIKRAEEDVVVMAHTHRWDLRKYRNYRGNQVIYANTGCWTNKCDEFSSVVIHPPTDEDDGKVEIDHGKNNE